MEGYPVRYYFLGVILIMAFYFFSLNLQTGLIFFLFFVLSKLSLSVVQSNFYKGVIFVFLFSVAAGYFIRPIILVNHPEMFMYPKIASRTDIKTINHALLYALISTTFLLAGFIFIIKGLKDRIVPERKNSDFMMRNYVIINSLIILLTVVRLALAIVSKVGIKGEANVDVTFAFLLRLLSPEMTFIIYYVYLSRYWKRLSLKNRFIVVVMILITGYSVFITGSKTFIAIFGLCFFFDFIYQNRKIKLTTFSILSFISVVLIAFSFVMAAAEKFKGNNTVIDKAQSIANSEEVLTLGNAITQRMIGLDGQIATYMINDLSNQKIKIDLTQSYSPKQEILHTLNIIVPKIQFTTTLSSAKLISIYINGFSVNKVHAGSLGLFAGIYFMSGSFFFLFNIVLGMIVGLFFIFVRRQRNNDLKFILFFVGAYFILRMVLSGNFDLIIGEFTIEITTFFFYIKLISFIGAKY